MPQGDHSTTNLSTTLTAEYVPIENLALEVHLPFAAVRYNGSMPHPPPGKWDDGAFHYAVDARVAVRYQLLDAPYVAFSPHIAVTTPLSDYATNGFATGGRHLRGLHLGASFGRTFAPVLPHLFVSGTFEYTISEHYDVNPDTAKINQDRYDVGGQIGWSFLDGDLLASLGFDTRHHLGGIDMTNFNNLPQSLTDYHDPILHESYWVYGGGASYAISTKWTIALIVRGFLRGYNTRDQNLYGVELAWRVL